MADIWVLKTPGSTRVEIVFDSGYSTGNQIAHTKRHLLQAWHNLKPHYSREAVNNAYISNSVSNEKFLRRERVNS